TTQRLDSIRQSLDDVRAKQVAIDTELQQIDLRIATNRDRLEQLRTRVSARAAFVYTRGGSEPFVPLVIDNRTQLRAGQKYANAANSVDDDAIDDISRLEESLQRDRDQRSGAREDLDRTEASLLEDQSNLEQLRLQEQALIDQWGAVPVLGAPQLNANEIAGWFASTKIRPDLPAGLAIDDLAHLFIDEGQQAGVRGDIAFAQSVVETGSFTEFKGYNFSGIGVCDSCTGGDLFDTPRDGVRAQ